RRELADPGEDRRQLLGPGRIRRDPTRDRAREAFLDRLPADEGLALDDREPRRFGVRDVERRPERLDLPRERRDREAPGRVRGDLRVDLALLEEDGPGRELALGAGVEAHLAAVLALERGGRDADGADPVALADRAARGERAPDVRVADVEGARRRRERRHDGSEA